MKRSVKLHLRAGPKTDGGRDFLSAGSFLIVIHYKIMTYMIYRHPNTDPKPT
ncbi:hypothetical protein BH10PLA1_BH10PLA1_04320 [soil metagenome]